MRGFLVTLALALTGCANAPKEPNVVGVFAGATIRGGETGFSTGVKYVRKVSEKWGVGAVVEFTPQLDERLVTVPALFAFPYRGLSLVVAPGIETEDGDVSFMTRVGAGWDFELGRGFSLAPEVNVDFVEGGGDIPVVLGLTLGYDF